MTNATKARPPRPTTMPPPRTDYRITEEMIDHFVHGGWDDFDSETYQAICEYLYHNAPDLSREERENAEKREFAEARTDRGTVIIPLDAFPPYLPEAENTDILIKGRWLERGGSAWIISTAGTGKSIHSLQLALSMTAGRPFSGLMPNLKRLNFWIIQSEDSPSRIAIDRADVLAELNEQAPSVDWNDCAHRVRFVTFTGKVGAAFIEALEQELAAARAHGTLPDVIIINPFLAFIGGPVTDGAFVTPFLRGGVINGEATIGLQAILERYGVAALVYHHTPKPPSEKDIDAWLSATFPEYQGAGSSDITNWGRSFITMMRPKGREGIVCLTAGKNGSELGWDKVDGVSRHYLAWSDGLGITGGNRHAWRELSDAEFEEVTKVRRADIEDDVQVLAAALREEAMTYGQVAAKCLLSRSRFRAAWSQLKTNILEYGLACVTYKSGPRGNVTNAVYGKPEAARLAAKTFVENYAKCQMA